MAPGRGCSLGMLRWPIGLSSSPCAEQRGRTEGWGGSVGALLCLSFPVAMGSSGFVQQGSKWDHWQRTAEGGPNLWAIPRAWRTLLLSCRDQQGNNKKMDKKTSCGSGVRSSTEGPGLRGCGSHLWGRRASVLTPWGEQRAWICGHGPQHRFSPSETGGAGPQSSLGTHVV